MKRIFKIIIPTFVFVLIGTSVLIYLLIKPDTPRPPDGSPYFVGIRDMEIEQGQTIAYRDGVTAYDGNGEEISFLVSAKDVDIDTPGSYTVTYIATDDHGNTTRRKITVTVLYKPKIPIETLYALVDENIRRYGMDEMSKEELAVFLYSHIKKTTEFVNESDKSDWVAEAYRALTDGEGDCFTYYAVARAYFNRCGVETVTVQRIANARPGTHYWLLVNMGTPEKTEYYHWDCCPHYKEYPLYSCLLTDEELLAYNKKVENYYLFDTELYPSTPETPYW
ncbi:MAG: DUF5011 domain-containing protein [Clostridia bacterium]|nr:DUF5011 domain-containing protein [Clostridia bacterium]